MTINQKTKLCNCLNILELVKDSINGNFYIGQNKEAENILTVQEIIKTLLGK